MVNLDKVYHINIFGARFSIRVPMYKSILCNGIDKSEIDVSECSDIEIEYRGVRRRIDIDRFVDLVMLISSDGE